MVGLGSWLFFVVFVVGCFGLGFLGFFLLFGFGFCYCCCFGFLIIMNSPDACTEQA